jgi:hypothetical protein
MYQSKIAQAGKAHQRKQSLANSAKQGGVSFKGVPVLQQKEDDTEINHPEQNESSIHSNDIQPVQMVKDAFAFKLPKKDLKLHANFTAKHVAEDAEAAKATTHKRFVDGKMPVPMQNGKMANTVAKSANWLDAVEASDSVIDTTNNEWTRGVGIAVDGWAVKYKPNTDTYEAEEISGQKLAAGGYATAEMRKKQVVGQAFVVDHVENG